MLDRGTSDWGVIVEDSQGGTSLSEPTKSTPRIAAPMLTCDIDEFVAMDVIKDEELFDLNEEILSGADLITELARYLQKEEAFRICVEDWLLKQLPKSEDAHRVFQMRFAEDMRYQQNLDNLRHALLQDKTDEVTSILDTIYTQVVEETDFELLVFAYGLVSGVEEVTDARINKLRGDLFDRLGREQSLGVSRAEFDQLVKDIRGIYEVAQRADVAAVTAGQRNVAFALTLSNLSKSLPEDLRTLSKAEAAVFARFLEATKERAIADIDLAGKKNRGRVMLALAGGVALASLPAVWAFRTLDNKINALTELQADAPAAVSHVDWQTSPYNMADTVETIGSEAKALVVNCGSATLDGKFSEVALTSSEKPAWITADSVREACEGREAVIYSTWD